MGTDRTIFTVLRWTFFGRGALLAVVGIPLPIVGIVRVSSRPAEISLSLDERGSLAVRFQGADYTTTRARLVAEVAQGSLEIA